MHDSHQVQQVMFMLFYPVYFFLGKEKNIGKGKQ